MDKTPELHIYLEKKIGGHTLRCQVNLADQVPDMLLVAALQSSEVASIVLTTAAALLDKKGMTTLDFRKIARRNNLDI